MGWAEGKKSVDRETILEICQTEAHEEWTGGLCSSLCLILINHIFGEINESL